MTSILRILAVALIGQGDDGSGECLHLFAQRLIAMGTSHTEVVASEQLVRSDMAVSILPVRDSKGKNARRPYSLRVPHIQGYSYVEGCACELVSRNGNVYNPFECYSSWARPAAV